MSGVVKMDESCPHCDRPRWTVIRSGGPPGVTLLVAMVDGLDLIGKHRVDRIG
jgi:hypothetical protein